MVCWGVAILTYKPEDKFGPSAAASMVVRPGAVKPGVVKPGVAPRHGITLPPDNTRVEGLEFRTSTLQS